MAKAERNKSKNNRRSLEIMNLRKSDNGDFLRFAFLHNSLKISLTLWASCRLLLSSSPLPASDMLNYVTIITVVGMNSSFSSYVPAIALLWPLPSARERCAAKQTSSTQSVKLIDNNELIIKVENDKHKSHHNENPFMVANKNSQDTRSRRLNSGCCLKIHGNGCCRNTRSWRRIQNTAEYVELAAMKKKQA